jgi:MFS superfamily sulfate permease-like transporter
VPLASAPLGPPSGFSSLVHRFVDLRSSLSGSPRADILSGLTVALALVPEAVAFAFLAGLRSWVSMQRSSCA